MLLLISVAIDGDMQFDANLSILGPIQSRPVALDESSLLIYDVTSSVVIKGILKLILFDTLEFTKFLILSIFGRDTPDPLTKFFGYCRKEFIEF